MSRFINLNPPLNSQEFGGREAPVYSVFLDFARRGVPIGRSFSVWRTVWLFFCALKKIGRSGVQRFARGTNTISALKQAGSGRHFLLISKFQT